MHKIKPPQNPRRSTHPSCRTKKLTHAVPMTCDCQLRRDPGVVCSDWFDNQNVHNSKTSGQTMASTSSTVRPDRYSAHSVTPGNKNLRRKEAQNAQNKTTTKSPQVNSPFMSNAKVSDGSQPPMTFDLSLSESAGSRSLDRLVRHFPQSLS